MCRSFVMLEEHAHPFNQRTSFNNSGSSFCRKSTYARPVRRIGNTADPINWLSIAPHHTFTEKRCWEFLSQRACGFWSDNRCELWLLFIPSRVKLTSSVNSMNGFNRRLAITHRHKSSRLTSSLSSRRCTICRWKGYRPCWRKVRHTLVCGTAISVEILRVLVRLRSTDWRMLSTLSTFCSFAHSEEIWLLGSVPVSRSLL